MRNADHCESMRSKLPPDCLDRIGGFLLRQVLEHFHAEYVIECLRLQMLELIDEDHVGQAGELTFRLLEQHGRRLITCELNPWIVSNAPKKLSITGAEIQHSRHTGATRFPQHSYRIRKAPAVYPPLERIGIIDREIGVAHASIRAPAYRPPAERRPPARRRGRTSPSRERRAA